MKSLALIRLSTVSAVLMLIMSPLHAVAYLRTPDGESGVIDWTPSAYQAASWLWDWGPRQSVYIAYGRVTSVLLIGALLGLLPLHWRQRTRGASFERWSFRAFAIGYGLLAVGSIIEYYTPFLEKGFMFIAIPGLILTLLSGLVFGVASSRMGVIPRSLALFLGLSFFPGVPIVAAVLGHIPLGFFPLMIALILLGLRLSRLEKQNSLAAR